jgi:hypothetical protein
MDGIIARQNPDRRRPPRRWAVTNNDEARSLQMLDQALGDDSGHHLGGLVDPLVPTAPEREHEGAARPFDRRVLVGRCGHEKSVSREWEQDKNGMAASAETA